MDRIILRNRFSTHQRIIILLYIGAPLIFLIVRLIMMKLNYVGYLMLGFSVLLYAGLICVAFLRRGFIKIGEKAYRGSFFLNRLIFKTRIKLENRPIVSILKFKKISKMAFFSAANPDPVEGFNGFDIYILNKNHTQREFLLSLKNIKDAEKGIDFLTRNFNLQKEVFCPKFR